MPSWSISDPRVPGRESVARDWQWHALPRVTGAALQQTVRVAPTFSRATIQ